MRYKPLSPRVFRFVDEYARSKNKVEAAIRAGAPRRSASEWANHALDDPRVQTAIEERLQAIADAANVDAVWALQQWVQLATADPSLIAHVRRVNCRYCHGVGHQYQWTSREYTEASAKALSEGLMPPSCSGGLGFEFNADPDPDCPECLGEGVGHLHINDTRFLTGPERLLVAGIKQTRDGIEVKFRDQDGALKVITEYLGMLVKRGEGGGSGLYPPGAGRPALPMVEEVLPTDPKQLEALYLNFTKNSR